MLKVASWEAIRKDRFSLTPEALFDELVRNTQFTLTSWRGDATRRQERMRAPLEESEEKDDLETEGEQNTEAGASEKKLRSADRFGLDIDAEFRTKKFKARFRHWQEVAKVATEVALDEIRTLLEWGPQLLWRPHRGAPVLLHCLPLNKLT